MGRRGPVPKPDRLRVLHADRRDRVAAGPPVPSSELVAPPADLDADALAIFERLAADLQRQDVLTHWDPEQLGIYCTAVVQNHRARAALNRDGAVIDGYRGSRVKHPAWQVFRESAEVATRLAGRFGLTPADRLHLSPAEPSGPQLPGEHLLSR